MYLYIHSSPLSVIISCSSTAVVSATRSRFLQSQASHLSPAASMLEGGLWVWWHDGLTTGNQVFQNRYSHIQVTFFETVVFWPLTEDIFASSAMITADVAIRLLVRLRRIDYISFFVSAVVTFLSKISVWRSLILPITSLSIVLYSSLWIPSLSLSSSRSRSSFAISSVFQYSPVKPPPSRPMCHWVEASTALQKKGHIWVKYSSLAAALPFNSSTNAVVNAAWSPFFQSRTSRFSPLASPLKGGLWFGCGDVLPTGY